MNWEKKGCDWHHPGFIQANILDCTPFAWVATVNINSRRIEASTEEEAKTLAEARMNEIKKEFIRSLVTKILDTEYGFGGLLEIFGGYEGVDEWRVYHGDTTVYEGTLEECKNYIVSCF